MYMWWFIELWCVLTSQFSQLWNIITAGEDECRILNPARRRYFKPYIHLLLMDLLSLKSSLSWMFREQMPQFCLIHHHLLRFHQVLALPPIKLETKKLWPTDRRMKLKVWAKPRMLKIGVPLNKGFNEFIAVEKDDDYTNEYKVTGGFTIEVFRAILRELPFKVKPIFHPIPIDKYYKAKTYDQLLKGIPDKSYDIVVGDTTILANGASFVDFTLPYLASKIVLIVPTEHDKCNSMWMFIIPFSPVLWLMVGIASIFAGLVLGFLERRVNNNEFGGPLYRQFFVLFWLPLSMLVLQEFNFFTFLHILILSNYVLELANIWSKALLFIWFCVAYIVMQSYAANLSLMLTADQTGPAMPKEFRCVGYQEGSFVKELLIKEFNFTESQLKPYSTIEEYHKALSKGSRNGGVECIYDELPCINLFLRKYSSKYTMVGPVYDTAGFGFAFRLGSPLLPHFSRAILNVTGSSKMRELKEKYFGECYFSPSDQPTPDNPSLGTYSFVGLFMMAAAATILVIICSECSLRVRSINQRPPSDLIDSMVHYSTEMINDGGERPIDEYPIGDDQEHPPTTAVRTGEFSVDEGQEAEEKES